MMAIFGAARGGASISLHASIKSGSGKLFAHGSFFGSGFLGSISQLRLEVLMQHS